MCTAMTTYAQSRVSGTRFEDQLLSIIKKYTNKVWSNVRIETLLTVSGTTEVDLLVCIADIVLLIEAKNVAMILGDYADRYWTFTGSRARCRDDKEYTKLNVIMQNNIHVRSFKDCYFAYFQEWPLVLPVIVVPNDCKVSPGISKSVYTASQLDDFLATEIATRQTSSLHRRLQAMMAIDDALLSRPDFTRDAKTGQRAKLTLV